MGFEERFNHLVEEKARAYEEYKKEKAKEWAEIQRVSRAFSPRIEKICRAFAKATGWDYEHKERRSIEGETERFHLGQYHGGSCCDTLTVSIVREGISVKGYSHGVRVYEEDASFSPEKPIEVEEKLVQFFESWYRKHG